MSEAEKMPISGTVTLTAGDNMHILLSQFPTMIRRLSAFLAIVFICAAAASIALDESLSFASDPLHAVTTAARGLWPFPVGIFVFILAFVLIANALKWAKYPQPSKIVTYVADERGITTSDAAGASMHVPWSMVQQSRRTRRHVIMKMVLGGMRFAPLRAFEAPEAFWDLVREKTPTS